MACSGALQVELIIERTVRAALQGRVTISHGFCLGELPEVRRERLVAQLGEADIAWTTVALARTAPLPVVAMAEHGVTLGLGTDGIRDLWAPFGDGDLLRIALGFARLHALRTDEELTGAVGLATSGAAGFVGRERHGLVAGARADVVVLDALNVPDALVRVPPRHLVVAGGKVVVDHGELVDPLAGT